MLGGFWGFCSLLIFCILDEILLMLLIMKLWVVFVLFILERCLIDFLLVKLEFKLIVIVNYNRFRLKNELIVNERWVVDEMCGKG